MLEDLNFNSFKEKFKNDKRFKIIVLSVGTLLCTVLLLFGYYQFFYLPKDEASNDIYVETMNSVSDYNDRNQILYQIDYLNKNKSLEVDSTAIDSLEVQISRLNQLLEEKENNISKQIRLLESNIEEYEGYSGEQAAKYVLATCYMRNENYDKALALLEELDFSDTFLSSIVPGLKGDCNSDLGNYSEAYKQYAIAYNTNENDFTTPIYLWKAGLVAEKLNQFEEAAYCYQKLKDNYSGNDFLRSKRLDFHLERAKSATVK